MKALFLATALFLVAACSSTTKSVEDSDVAGDESPNVVEEAPSPEANGGCWMAHGTICGGTAQAPCTDCSSCCGATLRGSCGTQPLGDYTTVGKVKVGKDEYDQRYCSGGWRM